PAHPQHQRPVPLEEGRERRLVMGGDEPPQQWSVGGLAGRPATQPAKVTQDVRQSPVGHDATPCGLVLPIIDGDHGPADTLFSRAAGGAMAQTNRRKGGELARGAAPGGKGPRKKPKDVLLGLRYSDEFANALFQEVLGMEQSATYQAIVRR